MKLRILVDFDGTIVHVDPTRLQTRPDTRPVKLKDGAAKALRKLARKYDIVIYTGRLDPEWNCYLEQYEFIETFLKKHKIPYAIIMAKPCHVHAIIDDRAVNFRDWGLLEELL